MKKLLMIILPLFTVAINCSDNAKLPWEISGIFDKTHRIPYAQKYEDRNISIVVHKDNETKKILWIDAIYETSGDCYAGCRTNQTYRLSYDIKTKREESFYIFSHSRHKIMPFMGKIEDEKIKSDLSNAIKRFLAVPKIEQCIAFLRALTHPKGF